MVSKIVLLVLSVLIASSVVLGQKGEGDEPLSEELYRLIEKRSKLIGNELDEGVDAEWAGVYWDGDHHPTVLIWAPSNGFLLTASHHTFAPTWVNYGKASFSGGRLRLISEMPSDAAGYFKLPGEYVGVKWGSWRFLVEEESLINFAYAVHSGSESQIRRYFTRPAQNELPRVGLPDLPTEFRKIMTMPAIKTRVVEFRKAEEFWSSEVLLDGGKNRGLKEGVELYYSVGNGKRYISLRISSVSEKTATAKLSLVGGSDSGDLEPRKGMAFSSKRPKGFIDPD